MGMKRLFLLGILLGILAGCVQPDQQPDQTADEVPTPELTPEQYHAATQPFLNCMAQAAAKVDDHISQASVIAQAIEGACPNYWPAVIQAKIAGFTPSQGAGIAEAMQDPSEQYNWAVLAVLAERKATDTVK